jgi:hypothetical protein
MEAIRKLEDQFEAEARITELVELKASGGPDGRQEALAIAREWGFVEKGVNDRFDEAELALEELGPKGPFKSSAPQPGVESTPKAQPAGSAWRRPLGATAKTAQVKPQEVKSKPVVGRPDIDIGKIGHDDKKPVIGWPKHWPEAPNAPVDASAFERLLYPPGLLGHAVQYVVDTSQLPDRQLALAVSLSALAKGMDRKIVGPSGNSCVLFNQVLAETGAGKHQGISCSRSLLRAMGLESSIVASGLASVQAIEEIIEGVESPNPASGLDPNPNALVVIDEVGSWLMRILARGQGGNVSEIPGILQTLWGQPVEDGWIGTKKVGKKMRTFYNVAFSIIGFSTERMFFGALEDRLVSSGFVNRMLVWNAGRGALKRVDPRYSWTQCPGWLVGALKRATNLAVAPLDEPMKGLPLEMVDGSVGWLRDFHRLDWGPGAKERWLKFEDEIRAMPSVEDRELWIRAPDLAVRLATVVAFYRCSATVDVVDWDWAVELVKYSVAELRRGIDEHMSGKIEQADLAKRIRGYVRDRAGKYVTIGELCKAFERKVDDVRKLEAVIWHVERTRDIIQVPLEEVREAKGESRAGKPTIYFRWNRRGH